MYTLINNISAKFFIGSILLLLASCTDKIQVDLQEGPPLLVVDGSITDLDQPPTIILTKTQGYYNTNTPPIVSGASIILSDDQGNTETLTEVSLGKYQAPTLRGRVGGSYLLNITAEGQTYTASTEIPFEAPPIDSIVLKFIDDFSVEDDDKGYYAHYYGIESEVPGERYRFKLYVNDELYNKPDQLQYASDQFVNGNYISDFRLHFNDRIQIGDKVRVEVLSLPEDAFFYYNEISEQISNEGLFAVPPTNVRTNIKNTNPNGPRAVGYFLGASIKSIEGVFSNENNPVIK